MAIGVVKFFKTGKGWGAIASDELPELADVWVHFSVIDATGYRELAPGDVVEFEFESARQDGFRYRATHVKWLAPGPAPILRRRGGEVRIEPNGSPDTPLTPRRNSGRQ